MATARETVERHGKAVVEGNIDVLMGDITPEAMPTLQPLAEKLGPIQPTAFEIVSESEEGDQKVFRVKYIGETGSVTVESTWALIGEEWKVVKAVVV